MYGIPLKTIIQTIGILALVGLVMHVGCQAKKLAGVKVALEQQIAETKRCNESVYELTGAVDEQTAYAEASQQAAAEAHALYEHLRRRDPEVRYVPRERIVEVVRPGDCQRAALDAWDLLNGGDASWGYDGPTVSDWQAFYASTSELTWGVAPQSLVHRSFPVVSELRLYATQSPYQMQGLTSLNEGVWISGYMMSHELR